MLKFAPRHRHTRCASPHTSHCCCSCLLEGSPNLCWGRSAAVAMLRKCYQGAVRARVVMDSSPGNRGLLHPTAHSHSHNQPMMCAQHEHRSSMRGARESWRFSRKGGTVVSAERGSVRLRGGLYRRRGRAVWEKNSSRLPCGVTRSVKNGSLPTPNEVMWVG